MFLYVWFFILGCIIGSFFWLCQERLPLKMSVIKGRSFCFGCLHPLQWNDLIPIISFVALKGKCRYCQRKLSLVYPLFEIMSGTLLVLMIYFEPAILKAILLYLLIMDFIILSVIDIHWQIIPNEMIVLEMALSVLISFYIKIPVYERILGMCVVSLPMFFMNCLISNSFGGGDIKLMIVSGFLLGYKKIILAFMIAVITGGIYAFYLLLHKQANAKSHMAFGQFLCFGIIVSFFWGQHIFYAFGI